MADAQAVERPGPGNHSNNVRKFRPSKYAEGMGKYKKTIYNWLNKSNPKDDELPEGYGFGDLPIGAWYNRLPSKVYEVYVDREVHPPFVQVGDSDE